MESRREVGRLVLACALAAAVSLTLAVVVVAYFPTSEPNASFYSVIGCKPSGQGVLNLQPGLNRLEDNETTVINGSTYWETSFILGWAPSVSNGTATIISHGAYFDVWQGWAYFLGKAVHNGSFALINATLLPARSNGGSECYYLLPTFYIHFSPCSFSSCYPAVPVFGYNGNSTAFANPSNGSITWPRLPANPWFTSRADPRAGIAFSRESGEITLYVRVD